MYFCGSSICDMLFWLILVIFWKKMLRFIHLDLEFYVSFNLLILSNKFVTLFVGFFKILKCIYIGIYNQFHVPVRKKLGWRYIRCQLVITLLLVPLYPRSFPTNLKVLVISWAILRNFRYRIPSDVLAWILRLLIIRRVAQSSLGSSWFILGCEK